MSWEEIKEACEVLGIGNEIPVELKRTIEYAMKVKNVFRPQPFTIGDFTSCVLAWKVASQKKAR